MKEKRWDLKTRMLIGFIGLILLVSAIITMLFLHTNSTMRMEYRKLVRSSVEGVVNSIDSFVKEIYNASDSFVDNEQLDEYLDREYGENQRANKLADTIRLYNQIITSNDRLQQRQKIGAIYTGKGILFNFKDANWDGQEVIERLEELGVNDKEHLMRFYWYPLQNNFMESNPYGEVRKDKVIIGARRVYSVWKSAYVCTHIFCIYEKELYETYKESVVETKGDIYILNADGALISSSNENAVMEGRLDDDLKSMVLERTDDEFNWTHDRSRYLVCVRQSSLNKWLTVAVIPVKSITGEVDRLYLKIFLVLAVCMLFISAMFLYLYRSFINPINELSTAMTAVDGGNLNAYVKESGRYEIAEMMRHYNSMLRSIHVHVVEKLEADRKKKELELEVLMSQINPHFLYNTLETIVWKSNEAGHPDIGRLAASLGRMYRLSISGGQTIVPMQQEIEHVMAYVKIQKNRYGEDFVFDLRTEADFVRKLYCLKLLLQPVVENSFLYGMEELTHRLCIRLKIREIGNGRIEIRVIDNGCGMDRDQLGCVREQIRDGRTGEIPEGHRRSTGIGLHNVAARITLYFGIEEPIHVYSRKGIGTITRIQLPKLKSGEQI